MVRRSGTAGLVGLAVILLLGLVISEVVLRVRREDAPVFPPCRKSLEIHALRPPGEAAAANESGASDTRSVFFFGGKGFVWQRTGHLDVSKGKGWKKKVTYFGMEDMWQFDPTTKIWLDTTLEPGTSAPSPRWKFTAATFDEDTRLVLFGGCETLEANGVLNDMWVFEFTSGGRAQWRQVTTENIPPPRRGHVTEVNKTHVVVFGGKSFDPKRGPYVLKDLWTLPLEALRVGDATGFRWTRGADLPAIPRWGSTGVVLRKPDGTGDVLGLFGGRRYKKTWGYRREAVYKYYNDLFLYDFAMDNWTHLESDGTSPQARDHHGAARVGNDMYVFGGRVNPTRAADATLADVWSWSPETGLWTEHPRGPGDAPAPRFMPGVAGMELDGERGLAIAGGEILPGSTKLTTVNDFWVYLPAEGRWELLSGTQCGPQDTMYTDRPHDMFAASPAPWGGAGGGRAAIVALAGAALLAAAVAAAVAARGRPSARAPLLAAERDDASSTRYVTLC